MNTVFARVFPDANSALAQGFQKTNMLSIERSLYLLTTSTITERSVLVALVFHYKDMLEKV